MTITNCVLEVDESRGVIYVHGPEGKTLLRVCGCPPGTAGDELLDITLKFQRLAPHTFSWGKIGRTCLCGIGDDLQNASRHSVGCPMRISD